MSKAQALREMDFASGFWTMTGHPAVLDAAASIRPDFICIDTQHGISLATLDASSFTVLAHYGVPSLVRVQALDPALIGRALDLGADGVVVPMIESVDDARRAVAACRLAPGGSRSFGVQTRRIDPIPEIPPVCWLQVETRPVMEALDEIAALEGVDGMYIGPADLGLALVGETASDVESVFDGTHRHATAMGEAFDAVLAACRQAGIAAGLHCGSGRAAAIARDRGFRFAAVAADLGLIMGGLAAELSSARSAT